MRNFWLFLSVIWLWTCSGGGDKATGPEEPPIVINLTSLGGQAQKGPFNNGTAINVAELTNTLSPTGRNFSSAITDNTGRFAVANVQLESPYVELRANGYYFNEVSNEISSGQLTLFALSNLTGKTSLNVNILTHLEKNRMVTLMSGDNPKTFAQAKLQAQEEVLAIFDYSRADVPESELLDISQSGAANAKLLAMSAIIQGDLTVGQMSQLLANMSTDIASDGTLDDTNLRNTLIENSKNLDMEEVRSHLEAHYSSLGVSANIADFETEVYQFLKPPTAQNINASTAEDTPINITLAGSDPEGESLTYTILEVNNATVTLNGNVATYTPGTHFNGTDTFTYYANDGTSDSNIATVTMTVSAEDDDPNTLDVATTTDEDVAVTVNLSAEEYDGDSYSFAIITDVSNGTTSLNGSTVTYTPNQDFNGEDTFTFEATDDRTARTNVATATITVNPVNDAPVATDVNINSNEDEVVTYDLSSNVSDVDGDDLTYSLGNVQPMWGSVTLDGSILTYTPNANYYGTDNLNWKVSDGGDDNVTRSFNITISSVNDVPIATDMTVSTNETRFTSLDITLDVTDADGDALTYSIESNVSNGTTTLNGGVVTYVPTTDWNGEDSFTFKANDGTVDSNIATTTITVNVVDDAPVVVDSTFVIDEDQIIDFTLRANDVDDENQFTWAVQSDPSNGTIVIQDANIISSYKNYRYTPNTNYNGNDSFTYYATNQNAQISNTATISFTINPVNDGPIANNLDMTVDEDSSGSTIAIKGDDNGATDPEGDAITYYIVDAPSNGSIYNDAGGGQPDGDALAAGDELTSFFTIYNPNANYNGVDTFTFKGSDGTLDGNTATVQITVSPVNDAPVAEDKSVLMDEDWQGDGTQYYPMKLIASDIDNTSLTFSVVSNPTNGNIGNGFYTNAGSGANADSIAYKPNANWNGTDTFTYKVNDGTDDSNTATVTITVNPVNDAPVTQNVSFSTNEDTPYTESYTSYVNDVEGDNLTITTVTDPTNGNATCDNATNCTYTPNQNYYGTDSFTYKVNDGEFDSNISTVSVTINSVNDAPNCSSVHNVSTNEDESLVINLPCTDIESDALTTVFLSNYKTPQNGTLNVDGITITYTPNANYEGLDSFEYHVYDGTNQSGVEVVNITVNSVNDAPVASAVSTSTAKNTAKTITLSATDVDTGSLTYSIVSNPSNGSLGSVNGATVTYTPDNNWSGTDTFTYKANDGNSDGNTATVTVKVVSNSKSLDFDGDDLVYMSGSTGVFTSAMTVQAWAKADALQSNKYIVSKGKNTDNTFRAYGLKAPYTSSEVDNNGNSGKWLGEMNVGGTEYYISSSTDAVLNEWAHLLMTYDGSNIKLYVNGQLEGTQSASGNIGGNNSSGVRFAVGSLEINDSRYRFDGTIDEVAIWNDALSLSDINTLYNGGKGTNAYDVRTSDLSGYWNFDGNTNDLSSNGNNGSFQEGSGSDDFEPTYVDDSPEI